MAFREVRVFEVREVLPVAAGRGVQGDGAVGGGGSQDGSPLRGRGRGAGSGPRRRQGAAERRVRRLGGGGGPPHRSDGRGEAWRLLVAHHQLIEDWLRNDELTVRKVHEWLGRRGIVVAERTLHRYALELCDVGRGRRGTTVRVNDGEPGDELQIDFGKLGLVPDPVLARRRVAHALIFTPVVSRYSFVWLSFGQTIEDVIAGGGAGLAFYYGVFATAIPDNLKAIVERADATEPRLNQAFVEYAQSRGFVVDPARVRSPRDKPRVERVVPFVRQSFFAGECFVDLADAQRRAETWCPAATGMRVHGTIQARPAEVFRIEEQPRLAPAPATPYDVPIYTTAKVHRDHHIEVAKALTPSPATSSASASSATTSAWCGTSSEARRSRCIPASGPAGAAPTRATCPPSAPPMRCGTWTTSAGSPPGTARPSAPSQSPCWTRRCRGRRCARSTRCWAWSGSGAPIVSTRRAPAPWPTRPSTSGSLAACSNAAPRTRPDNRRCPAWSSPPASPTGALVGDRPGVCGPAPARAGVPGPGSTSRGLLAPGGGRRGEQTRHRRGLIVALEAAWGRDAFQFDLPVTPAEAKELGLPAGTSYVEGAGTVTAFLTPARR